MANVDVFWIFMLDYEKNWGVKRHCHDYFQLYYVASGNGTMEIESQRYSLSKDLCVLFFPQQQHELFEIQHGTLRIIDVKFYIRDPDLSAAILKAPQSFFMDSEFSQILLQARSEWKSHMPFHKNMANLLVEESLYRLLRAHSKVEINQKILPAANFSAEELTGPAQKVAKYVQLHYNEKFSLDQMALELMYNRNYLCKIFKQATGMTIVEYMNYLKISKAIDLLSYSDDGIPAIAEKCGFSDIHYFSRIFKKITGHSPGEFKSREKRDMYTDIVEHGTFNYRYYNDPKKK